MVIKKAIRKNFKNLFTHFFQNFFLYFFHERNAVIPDRNINEEAINLGNKNQKIKFPGNNEKRSK